MTAAASALAAMMALIGVAAGLIFVASLHRGVTLLVSGGGALVVLALAAARFAAVVGVLVFAARHGAMALGAASLGFLAAARLAVRHAREAA